MIIDVFIYYKIIVINTWSLRDYLSMNGSWCQFHLNIAYKYWAYLQVQVQCLKFPNERRCNQLALHKKIKKKQTNSRRTN